LKGEFTYKWIPEGLFNDGVVLWEVKINGTPLTGRALTVRQAYRDAKRAVRRYRRMINFLNPNEPRI